jgi:hypothetical protein
MNTFQHPHDENEKHCAMCQEGCHKDIERAFGVLVQQLQILQCPIRNWYWEDIVDILDCCIILHNMVVESCRENIQCLDISTAEKSGMLPLIHFDLH